MNNSDAPDLDPLASRLEEALLLSDMSQTKFGYVHFGDPAFFLKMRRGRKFNRATIAKIEAILQEMDL